MELDAVLDRMAIADVIDDYAAAVDGRDWALLSSLFTADATLDYTSSGGPRGTRDEVVGWISQSLPLVTLTQHLVTNKRISVTGDSAASSCSLLNPLVFAGDDGAQLLLLGGRYEDRWRRTSDGWRITERVHVTDWTAGPFPAQLTEA